MLVSLKNKGFTLVEVLCSLGVFSIIFVCMMSFDVTALNMKKDISSTKNNIAIMEALKNNIIYSMTFEELKLLQTNSKFYVNSENMSVDRIRLLGSGVFADQYHAGSLYIKLTFSTLELNVYKLNLSLYSGKVSGTSELQCDFYKGDHK